MDIQGEAKAQRIGVSWKNNGKTESDREGANH
jgi:hypothetical protein